MTESVATILERELDFTIKEWLKRVNLVPELTKIPLNDASSPIYFSLFTRVLLS